jgi:hypothetical protein
MVNCPLDDILIRSLACMSILQRHLKRTPDTIFHNIGIYECDFKALTNSMDYGIRGLNADLARALH